MARTTAFTVTLELEAGNASLMTLGKMLGATGVKPFEVKRRYDELTARHRGEIIPAVITVDARRRWTMRLKTPPTASLIRAALGAAGSARPGHQPAGALTREQLRAIALRKLPDLNTTDLAAAMRIVAGTARSMGVRVAD
ncbi:uL11 family ribosomal protein [Nocardia thailandica]|uniref:Large ribosomal subunit protein uL11 n=1 Tax=Nocardia thailandica TaxID=257275 RepID=A0ABW6PS43_9NOCA